MHHQMKKFILAFPGMGKTTLALRVPGLIDLDYGSFRTALDVDPRQDQTATLQKYMKLANKYGAEGFTILSNEPQLMPYLKQSGWEVEVVLPAKDVDLADRISRRYGNDGGWHGRFLGALKKNQSEWVDNRIKEATKYDFKIHRVHYLSEVLK